ncbi:polysaccharide deacetylase family protein [Clostridium sp.]|uniref:polysaccharide deacetylase family protein n=1 Tax=Clostridium sp. TaxID=1506 RepID=UPI002606A82A|nr:polysaccharide deacetylase family protein [Clostridium sp.]
MKRRYKVIIGTLLLIMSILSSFILKDKESILGQGAINLSRPIYRVKVEEKVISLTFDINWAENDELDNILNVLDKYNVKGTFFIMGGWVNYSEDNKNKLINIYERGHEIGNHSYIHPMFTKISDDRIKEEIEKTEKVFMDNLGINSKLFRFPSGDYNEKSYNYVNSLGYQSIQWDVDSLDWKEYGADSEYNRVIDKVYNGSIVLFHNNAKYTPGNLDKIISKLKNEDYKFITVGEMIYKEDFYIDEKGEQNKKN